jgi:hypothetical protein
MESATVIEGTRHLERVEEEEVKQKDDEEEEEEDKSGRI